jgi:hypothetical protein
MSDVVKLKNLALIAQAPPRDFQHWQAGVALETPTFLTAAPITVLSYKVPAGYSLVITDIDHWVSNPMPGPTPGAPPAVQPLLVWGSLFAYFAINDEEITDKSAPLFSVAKSGKLLIFPQGQCARFKVWNGGPAINPAQFSLAFNFSGFLTLPEHAARLQSMASIVP